MKHFAAYLVLISSFATIVGTSDSESSSDNNTTIATSQFKDTVVTEVPEDIDLRKALFTDVLGDNIDLADRSMPYALFHKVIFPNVSFNGSNLSRAKFSDSKLKNADFRKAKLCYATFTNIDLSTVHFEGANLTGVRFSDCIITNAENFKGAIIKNTTSFPGVAQEVVLAILAERRNKQD